MDGDAGWARGWLGALEPLRQVGPEEAELRASGVSEAHIRNLFPALDLAQYSSGLSARLRNREVLAAVTTTLLMSETYKLTSLLPAGERQRIEAETHAAANDLLDVILAMPEGDRPAHFKPRLGFYLEDLNRALSLCQELLVSLAVLGLMAADDSAFHEVAARLDLRVHRHRLARLAQHLAG